MLGAYALTGDTYGSKSTAIGYAALQTQNFTTATDSFNTAVGAYAGVSVTTGQRNVLVGGLAGDANTNSEYTAGKFIIKLYGVMSDFS